MGQPATYAWSITSAIAGGCGLLRQGFDLTIEPVQITFPNSIVRRELSQPIHDACRLRTAANASLKAPDRIYVAVPPARCQRGRGSPPDRAGIARIGLRQRLQDGEAVAIGFQRSCKVTLRLLHVADPSVRHRQIILPAGVARIGLRQTLTSRRSKISALPQGCHAASARRRSCRTTPLGLVLQCGIAGIGLRQRLQDGEAVAIGFQRSRRHCTPPPKQRRDNCQQGRVSAAVFENG
jgi:hypothetical protein